MSHRGPKASPRLQLAAYQCVFDNDLNPVDALVDAGYSLNEITEQQKKNMSKNMLKFQDELEEKSRMQKNVMQYISTKKKCNGTSLTDISFLTNLPSIEFHPIF